MKILVVCRSSPFHAGSGGMEKIAFDLARAWQDLGHEVSYITTPTGGANAARNITQLPGTPARYSRSWLRQVAQLDLSDVDIVLSVSSAARLLTRRTTDVPIVLQAHGTSLDEIQTKLRLRSIRALVRLPKNLKSFVFDCFDYPKYTAVVGVGPSVTQSLTRQYPKFARPRRYYEILNGVRESTLPTPIPWEEREGIAFVGRIHAEKGLDILLRAAAELESPVTVCGDGPARSSAQRLAEQLGIGDRVRFLGRVDDAEVRDVLRRARALAVPSRRNEGLPLAVLEALVEGTPVVATPRLRATVNSLPGQAFAFSADDSPHAFKVALAQTTRSVQFDVQGIRLGSAPFTLPQIAASYIATFEELLGEQH